MFTRTNPFLHGADRARVQSARRGSHAARPGLDAAAGIADRYPSRGILPPKLRSVLSYGADRAAPFPFPFPFPFPKSPEAGRLLELASERLHADVRTLLLRIVGMLTKLAKRHHRL